MCFERNLHPTLPAIMLFFQFYNLEGKTILGGFKYQL